MLWLGMPFGDPVENLHTLPQTKELEGRYSLQPSLKEQKPLKSVLHGWSINELQQSQGTCKTNTLKLWEVRNTTVDECIPKIQGQKGERKSSQYIYMKCFRINTKDFNLQMNLEAKDTRKICFSIAMIFYTHN